MPTPAIPIPGAPAPPPAPTPDDKLVEHAGATRKPQPPERWRPRHKETVVEVPEPVVEEVEAEDKPLSESPEQLKEEDEEEEDYADMPPLEDPPTETATAPIDINLQRLSEAILNRARAPSSSFSSGSPETPGSPYTGRFAHFLFDWYSPDWYNSVDCRNFISVWGSSLPSATPPPPAVKQGVDTRPNARAAVVMPKSHWRVRLPLSLVI